MAPTRRNRRKSKKTARRRRTITQKGGFVLKPFKFVLNLFNKTTKIRKQRGG
tara:strand:- start:284 stop:439 length:156 start_codon:yes stop_codon:yes gene_type:complete